MAIFFIVFAVLAGSGIAFSEYIKNPDRGPYTQTFRYLGKPNDDPIPPERLQSIVDSNRTLTARVYYLTNLQQKPVIPQAYLQEIRKDLALIQKYGLRVILRFAYTDQNEKGPFDAPINVTKKHLDALKPVLSDFQHVISSFQCGFMGSWGEMYTTTYYKTKADKQALLRAVINAVPPTIPILVRTPAYYDMIPNDGVPSNTKDRIGMFDDCILADPTDMGTFTLQNPDTANLAAIRTAMARFKNIGTLGETCSPDWPDLLKPDYALKHFAAIKLMAMNDGYHQDVVSQWASIGFCEKVSEKLGYSPQLVSASTGGVTIRNAGWAKPPRINQAFAYLVPSSKMSLRKRSTGSIPVYKIPLPLWDIRTLAPDSSVTFPMSLVSTDGNLMLNEQHEVLIGIETGGVSDVGYRVIFAEEWGPRLNRIGIKLPQGTKLALNSVTSQLTL